MNLVSTAQLFEEARTHNAWLDKPVSEETLHQLYELMKWGPTAVNSSPGRIVFVTSGSAKEKLLSAMAKGNYEKTKDAPVTAIFAHDLEFYEKLPKLFPHADAKSWYAGNPELAKDTAFHNAALQSAYFIIAARALGLDAGPMGGFDKAKLDEAFFAGTSWRSNLVINLGYGDRSKLFPRGPRLAFEEASKIV